jgi:hypothetical protein
MRRRIDSTEAHYRDESDSPHHRLDLYDGKLTVHDPLPVLRDEALWAKLQAAYDHVAKLERAVLNACTKEPLDSVELECGVQLWRLISDELPDSAEERKRMMDEIDRMKDILRKHAETA